MNKKRYKISFIISTYIFFSFPTLFLITQLFNNYFTFSLGFRATAGFRLMFIVIFCSAVGTLISKAISKNTINTIQEINRATKEIASGNYNIRINEISNIEELNGMAENFNLMARDLAMSEIMKNDFINNVSHDFKTPLSAIEGYATLLHNKELSHEKVSDYAEHILYNSHRLTQMTSNILMLSTLDNSKITLKKSEYLLDEQIREVILLYENEWNEKNIDLDIDFEKVSFCGDKEFIMHVLQNLISNAIKFCDTDGKIKMQLQIKESQILFSISNSGTFIDSSDLQRIFEKFYRCDTSRSSKGNGLGLSIAKKVIDLHGGTISVSSEKEIGTTFTVTLPTII